MFGLALATATFLFSCNTCPFASGQQGKVKHAVFVWLKKPGNAADRLKLIDAAKVLKREIPEVGALTIGHAGKKVLRPMVKRFEVYDFVTE